MPSPPHSPTLSADIVTTLAALEGYPALDAETAARVAVGASNAVSAVAASVVDSSFEREPTDFLAELERLAEPGG